MDEAELKSLDFKEPTVPYFLFAGCSRILGGLGVYCTITIIRNPQTSIGNYLGSYTKSLSPYNSPYSSPYRPL